MVVPLHDVEDVVDHVLLRHIPGVAIAIGIFMGLHAAYAYALALTQRIERQADMFADDLAFRCLHGTGLER